jgi:hypothetical protein
VLFDIGLGEGHGMRSTNAESDLGRATAGDIWARLEYSVNLCLGISTLSRRRSRSLKR